jgi:hypothetical protein
MAVRPFYVRSEASGRATPIQGGPQKADGYQITTILQRDEGEAKELYIINQMSILDTKTGKRVLVCEIKDAENNNVVIHRKVTTY